MSSNKEFAENFKKRTKAFAVSVIKFCRKLPNNREANIISGQLMRCSTSVASNYRAACRGRSRKEFYAKMSIVVEEADETIFWLEVIKATKLSSSKDLQFLINEGNEILAVVAKSRKTTGKNLK